MVLEGPDRIYVYGPDGLTVGVPVFHVFLPRPGPGLVLVPVLPSWRSESHDVYGLLIGSVTETGSKQLFSLIFHSNYTEAQVKQNKTNNRRLVLGYHKL